MTDERYEGEVVDERLFVEVLDAILEGAYARARDLEQEAWPAVARALRDRDPAVFDLYAREVATHYAIDHAQELFAALRRAIATRTTAGVVQAIEDVFETLAPPEEAPPGADS